jgi:hypothetical protein
MKKHVITSLGLLLALAIGLFQEKLGHMARFNTRSYTSMANIESKSASYETVIFYTWEFGDDNTKIEAKVETLVGKLIDAPRGMPLSKLVIRNLKSQKEIFEEDLDDDLPGYVIIRDLDGDDKMELIATWNSGATSERIEILKIDEDRARRILDESYRVDASLIDLSGKATTVLITNTKMGAIPDYTVRYTWQGEQYKPAGKVKYEHFVKQVESLFNVSRPHSRRPAR